MRRILPLLLAAFLVGGCAQIDNALEGNPPPDATLRVDLNPSTVSVSQGGELAINATVSCLGECESAVGIMIEGAPAGVTAALGSTSVNGKITTAQIVIRVSASATLGNYSLTVRGQSKRLTDATRTLSLAVTEPPSFAVSVSSVSHTIIRGGQSALTVTMARTNLTAPIALALTGAPGISINFPSSPTTATLAQGNILVATSVAPGRYTATLTASATGTADRSVPITIDVSSDALQVLATSTLTAPQAATVTSDIIVNRANTSAGVTLSAEGLPSGMSISFDPVSFLSGNATAGTSRMTVQVGPSSVANYPIVIRARTTGATDATVQLSFTVTPASMSLSLGAGTVTVLQAASISTSINIARSSYEGAIAIDVPNAPTGLSFSVAPTAVLGSSAQLTVSALTTIPPGDYTVSVRGTPAGLPASATKTVALTVTVKLVPAGSGNLLLDWSNCAPPKWVAALDGGGAWTQLQGVGGIFRSDITQARGGVAFVDDLNAVNVRFMTREEMIARPLDMCGPVQGIKTVNAFATHHAVLGEPLTFRLGGGVGISTAPQTAFVIGEVREGTHDLVAWGAPTGYGQRGFIVRDLNIPNGGTLDEIDLASGFIPQQNSLSTSGILSQGEIIQHSMSYLTTDACTENLLYTGGNQGTVATMFGFPPSLQRPNDYHLVSVSYIGGAPGIRTSTVAFHGMAGRTVIMPPVVATPVPTRLTGSYTRLLVAFGVIASTYNSSATLRYTSGNRTMRVTATMAFIGTSTSLTMPDLSATPGWQDSYAIPSGANGTFSFILDGNSGEASACTEDRRTYQAIRNGVF